MIGFRKPFRPGRPEKLRPAPKPPSRADEIWQRIAEARARRDRAERDLYEALQQQQLDQE